MNTCISTDVLMYLNMILYQLSTNQCTTVSPTGVSMYVCYRLKLLYQCTVPYVSEPILLLSANNVRTKCILRDIYVYRCTNVSAYKYTSAFWPRVRARALSTPVFSGSLTRLRGAARPPPPAHRNFAACY